MNTVSRGIRNLVIARRAVPGVRPGLTVVLPNPARAQRPVLHLADRLVTARILVIAGFTRIASLLPSLLHAGLASRAATTVKDDPRIPVTFDTDIGTDIDDTWALAQILRSPELGPKLILPASSDQTYRSVITARFLTTAGRSDMPIGLGVDSKPMQPVQRNQDPWIKGYAVSDYGGKITTDGVGRMIEIIEKSPVQVTTIAVAPAGNLAAALARAPGVAARCRLVGMFGSFDVGYTGGIPLVRSPRARLFIRQIFPDLTTT